MTLPDRPIAFVLSASNHGSLIVNRNDQHLIKGKGGYGVGYQILTKSSFDPSEVGLALRMLDARRVHFGPGVVAIDGGANIGVHTIEWARHMHGWGRVLSFEAQEILFYALAGNIAINNCFNARARLAALGETAGHMAVPQPDYLREGSFGSLELRRRDNTEFIGQRVSYDPEACVSVPVVKLDDVPVARADFVKVDVEGMEVEVLRGASRILEEFRPILLVEFIKSDRQQLTRMLESAGYRLFTVGINFLAIHAKDPTIDSVSASQGRLTIASPR